MNTMESLWASFRKHIWNVISPRWLVIFLITFILVMFSDLIPWHDEKIDITPRSDALQLALFLILTQIILVVTMDNVYFPNAAGQKKDFSLKLIVMACGLLLFMLMVFISVMFSEYMLNLFSGLLGTKSNKAETLESIGYGIGGVFAVFPIIIAYDRINEEAKRNRLTEKKHRDEQFNSASDNLRDKNPVTRISAFGQFHDLAKHCNVVDFRKRIFDILCFHLRHSFTKGPITAECQTLLDILFKPKDKSIFDEFDADLQNINLPRADLSNANLTGANFSYATLTFINFEKTNLVESNFFHADLFHADFKESIIKNAKMCDTNLSCAMFNGADLSEVDFTGANLTSANFHKACLVGANLSGANLAGANFHRADLTGAYLADAIMTQSTKFDNADLTNAYFLNTDLLLVHFMNVRRIEGANFKGTKVFPAQLPVKSGKYIADWTSDEFWNDAEKNSKP